MGLITGSIDIDTSLVDLAYSQDPGVVAGELAGCGWCPVGEFAKVGDEADVVTVRNLEVREKNAYRNACSAGRPADANLGVIVVAAQQARVNLGGKRKVLKGAQLVKWLEALALQNTDAVDTLADRIVHVSGGGRGEDLYDSMRRALRVARIESQEGADGDSKSDASPGT